MNSQIDRAAKSMKDKTAYSINTWINEIHNNKDLADLSKLSEASVDKVINYLNSDEFKEGGFPAFKLEKNNRYYQKKGKYLLDDKKASIAKYYNTQLTKANNNNNKYPTMSEINDVVQDILEDQA